MIKQTVKQKVLALLREGTPMLSLDMARVLNLDKGTTSQTAKELHDAGLLHIIEWRCNPKNGGNKVYAYGKGIDAKQPETQIERQIRINAEKIPEPTKLKLRPNAEKILEPTKLKLRPQIVNTNTVFVPRPDEAAAWLRNPI